jgi:hypothetical protein
LRLHCNVGQDHAFQVTPSARRISPALAFVIRRSDVNTLEDLSVSIVFPHGGSATRLAPFLLPGSSGMNSPAFTRYYEPSTTTGRFSRHLVCSLAPPYLGLISSLCSSSRGNRRANARVLFNRCHPPGSGVLSPRTPSVLPSSLRTLLTFAVLLDSGRSLAPDPVQRSDVVPANCYLEDTGRL